MQIFPSSGIDQSWYDSSQILSRVTPKSFPELLKRVRRFDRDSFALMCSGCLWYSWSLPPQSPSKQSPLNFILERYALFITTLGIAFAAKQGREAISEKEFRILVGELFNLPRYSPDSEWFISQELTPFKEALKKSAEKYGILKQIDFDSEHLSAFLELSRMAVIQWEGYSYNHGDWIRSFLLYENFRALCIEKAYCSPEELEKAENTFFGTSYERFYKATWLLIAYFSSRHTNKTQCPGPFEPRREQIIPEELRGNFDINDNDFHLVVDRLSIEASKVRTAVEKVKTYPENGWLLSHELRTLAKYPIVKFDDRSPGNLYLSLSPGRLLQRTSSFLTQDIFQFFEENNVLKKGNRVFQTRGEALEAYVDLHNPRKDSLSRVEPSNYLGLRPDYLWQGERWNLIFELKVNLRPNSGKTLFHPSALAIAWEHLAEGLVQAEELIRHHSDSSRQNCLVIVSAEPLVELITNFKRAVKQWNLLSNTGIDAIGLLSLAQFEYIVANNDADEIAENIFKTYSEFNPSDASAELIDQDFLIPPLGWECSHLTTTWQRLLPGITI